MFNLGLTRTSSARVGQLSFVLKVPLRDLPASIMNAVQYDRIVQRACAAQIEEKPEPK